jgi:hypothetical protein
MFLTGLPIVQIAIGRGCAFHRHGLTGLVYTEQIL